MLEGVLAECDEIETGQMEFSVAFSRKAQKGPPVASRVCDL